MVEFPDPETRNVLAPECSRCPALVDSRERIAWGNGSREADVMIVGEAPASGDPSAPRWQGGNWTGMAYTGQHSGKLIRTMFEALGYGPDDVYVTNAVKCFPSDGTGSNREPSKAERDTCFSHLLTELKEVNPTVVVTTGKHATMACLDHENRPLERFLDAVLTPIECPRLAVTLLPLLHPSYQHVWLTRLDYTYDAYIDEIDDTLDSLLAA